MKMAKPSKEHLEKHYEDLKAKPFFAGLVTYMLSGPVVAMVWEAPNAAVEARRMLGATKPAESALGTIRGDYCLDVGRNLIHGSDSVASAEKEIKLWFPENLISWNQASKPWILE